MNFGTPVPLLIGIILILGALVLFFLEKFRPGYERDSDKVYAVLLLIAGLFLLAHLDMELLASFQQLLMAGMLTTLLIENIRSRVPRAEPLLPRDNRPPPQPRYDNRQSARRVYRAELDDRGVPLRDRPRAPQMGPAQEEYWPDDYNNQRARQRQPYEEYGAPVGQLQPSDERSRSDRYADNRYPDSNGRYGQRPPARPPTPQTDTRYPDGSESFSERRPDTASPNTAPSRPSARRPERPAGENAGSRPSGAYSSSREQPNGERALNVRPYSEAPKIDLPRDSTRDNSRDDDYRPTNRPEGASS
ncbi:MAG: Ycf66 family protein [Phormidesmis sp.]